MRRHRLLVSATPVLIALMAGGALAQVAAPNTPAPPVEAAPAAQVEQIVVTAQKRAENIQDVPLSIKAVTGATLVNAAIEDPVGLTKLVPALQINNTLFGSGVVIRIRGFGTAANSATDSDVAAYVDSAFIPRPGAILSSFLDVKSVEVLSGPQGTLFGRNAVMGAISINTNSPSMRDRSLDLTAEGGRFGGYSGTAVANVPVSDTFALRFAAKGSHTDGDYHNNLDGKTYGESSGVVGRISAKWDVAPNVAWTLRLDGAKTDGDGVYPQAVYVETATPAALAALAGFNAHFGGTPQVYASPPSYNFNQFFSKPYEHDDQWGIASDISWTLTPVLTARLIDTYRDWNNRQLVGDTIATSIDLLSVFIGTKSRAQSHELQLISSKGAFLGSKLGFTAGLYYFHEDFQLDTGFNAGSQFCTTLLSRAPFLIPPCQAGPQINAGLASLTQSVDSYAGYVQADYQILPNLELDLGARETSDRKTGSFVSSTPNPLVAGAILTPEGPEALKFSDTRPSIRASLSWHPTDGVMVFGTYSTGYKSGGFNSGPTKPPLDPTTRTFGSETANDYELGVKSVFLDRRLLLNATLFDTQLHNFQDRSFNGTSFLVRNSGDVRSRGVDVDGQFLALPNLNFTYGVTYLDSIYTKDLNAPGLEGCTGLPGCPLTQDLSGRTLDYSPKWHGNVGFEAKSNEFMGGYRASFAASEQFTSSFLTANTDNPQSRVPGYATTDLRVSLYSPNGRWQFDVFGTNVFDKHYYVSTVAQVLGGVFGVNDPATGSTLFRGFLGDPARYGVRLSAKF